MAAFNYSFRAVLASITILSGTVLSIAFLSNTFADSASAASKAATKKNFAAKCERVYGSDKSVKALAIEQSLSYQDICDCAQTNKNLKKQIGAAGIKCFDTKITNFNQPTITGEPPGPNPPPGVTLEGFNPGNNKNVGKATETPPNGTGSAGKFGVDLSSAADNGNCCAGGDKGASNGNK
jgi:hypothetical protein